MPLGDLEDLRRRAETLEPGEQALAAYGEISSSTPTMSAGPHGGPQLRAGAVCRFDVSR